MTILLRLSAPEGLVRERSLNDILTIVERSLNANAADVFVRHRGHLSLLDLANAPVGEHDEAVHVLLSAKTVYRGRACAARRKNMKTLYCARKYQYTQQKFYIRP